MNPEAVVAGSEAQVLWCIRDAQADIATLVSMVKRLEKKVAPDLLAALERLVDAVDRNAVRQEDWPELRGAYAAIRAARGAAMANVAQLRPITLPPCDTES